MSKVTPPGDGKAGVEPVRARRCGRAVPTQILNRSVVLAAPSCWRTLPIGCERLARALRSHRQHLGISTRALARLADISQPYVVALERARTPGAKPGPTPTIDVTARLAAALRIEPEVLMRSALRRRGAHVLLVIDGAVGSPLDFVAGFTASATQWVLAGSRADHDTAARRSHRSINLRRDGSSGYDSVAIEEALNRELAALCAGQPEETIGLMFADTSEVMSSLDDPTPLIDFEREWADVAARAAWSAGTHAAWNVCVYQAEALRQLADPVATSLDLIRHHDDVWVATGGKFAHGHAGRLRLLHHMKIAGSAD